MPKRPQRRRIRRVSSNKPVSGGRADVRRCRRDGDKIVGFVEGEAGKGSRVRSECSRCRVYVVVRRVMSRWEVVESRRSRWAILRDVWK